MPLRAITFDAYGTLVRNEDLMLVPQRIVADHNLPVSVHDVWRVWSEFYFEATQQTPFRTLRQIETDITARLLQHFGIRADATPYVDLFFEVTTKVELYPEVPAVLSALNGVRSAIVGHAWNDARDGLARFQLRQHLQTPLPFSTRRMKR